MPPSLPPVKTSGPMETTDYYAEKKWCPKCREYVRYLMSLHASYCVECGSRVKLFSSTDKRAFLKSLDEAKKQAQKRGKRVS